MQMKGMPEHKAKKNPAQKKSTNKIGTTGDKVNDPGPAQKTGWGAVAASKRK